MEREGNEPLKLEILPYDLTVCRLGEIGDLALVREFFFLGKTDEEVSLVCKTTETPSGAIEREDGWRGFRIQGVLDFSLVGILSRITGILAENQIGIFAVSTFCTDYLLVKQENFARALQVLKEAGYQVLKERDFD